MFEILYNIFIEPQFTIENHYIQYFSTLDINLTWPPAQLREPFFVGGGL